MLKKIFAVVLIFVSAAADAQFLRGTRVGSVTPSTGGVLMNLAPPIYFGGYSPLLNWMKQGSPSTLVSSTNGTLNGKQIWDNGSYLVPTSGELKNPLPSDFRSLERGIFTPVTWPQYQYEGTSFNNFAGQVWNVTWTGCSTADATFTVSGLGTGGSAGFSFTGNSGTFTFGTNGDIGNVAIKFTPTIAGACYTNPPRNIVISQSQYAANVAAGQMFNPDWIADVKQYGILRLMDWMQTNYSGISDSSQLADENFTYLAQPFYLASGAANISGTTMTVTGTNGRGLWQVGQTIVAAGLTGATTITGLGSGTGGLGTYTLTCSGGCPTLSGVTVMGVPAVGANGDYGSKGGVSPSLACLLANATGSTIEYPIPIAASNQFATDIATSLKACMPAGVKVKYSFSNENWNPGFDAFSYVQAKIANGISDWQGYRAAQLMDIIYNVYGTGQRSRWIGAMGSQTGNPAYTTSDITGAQAAITAGGLHTLTQLFDQVDVAPYWGVFFPTAGFGGANAFCISNVTVGATPTVTAPGHNFTNGQTVALFVSGGTMSTVLNSNAVVGTNIYATLSNVTTNTFDINVSTVGKTYGGGSSCANNANTGNYVTDSQYPKMADRSVALNISTPATYSTKFSFFAQQMSKAVLNGSATDASYGTVTLPAGTALAGGAGSIQDYLGQQALILNSYGLKLGEYEGGFANTFTGFLTSPAPQQYMEFSNQSQFDSGVVGDTTNTPANAYAVNFLALRAVKSAYPSQFNDLQGQSQYGPWGALRFVTDTANPRWQAIATENALGPYVDPLGPATGTYAYAGNGTNRAFFNSACSSCTDSFTPTVGTPATKIIVGIEVNASTPTLTSVVCDGVTLTLDTKSQTGSGRSAFIYSGTMASGTSTRTCNINWGSNVSFQNREFYAVTATGLTSSTPLAVQAGNPGNVTPISYTKGALLFTVGACSGGSYANTSGVTPGVTTTVASDIDNTNSASMAMFNAPFTSAIFSVSQGCANEIAAAVYR